MISKIDDLIKQRNRLNIKIRALRELGIYHHSKLVSIDFCNTGKIHTFYPQGEAESQKIRKVIFDILEKRGDV